MELNLVIYTPSILTYFCLVSEIDAALIEMAQAPEYQSQVLQMEAEFAAASWEVLQLGESSV